MAVKKVSKMSVDAQLRAKIQVLNQLGPTVEVEATALQQLAAVLLRIVTFPRKLVLQDHIMKGRRKSKFLEKYKKNLL